jgi:hypothetical protein
MEFEVELEPSRGNFQPVIDRRPLVPEPLPVRIVAVEDVELTAPSGMERELEEFYIGLLKFERDARQIDSLVLRAENVELKFVVFEPPMVRDSLRTLGIEVLSLSGTEAALADAEIPYVRQRGLMPGQDSISLQDPAGNWLSLTEIQLLR